MSELREITLVEFEIQIFGFSQDGRYPGVGVLDIVDRILVRSFRVQEPVTGYGVSAEWEAYPLKDAALHAGITNLYFADRQTLSILNGIYRSRTLIVYGD